MEREALLRAIFRLWHVLARCRNDLETEREPLVAFLQKFESSGRKREVSEEEGGSGFVSTHGYVDMGETYYLHRGFGLGGESQRRPCQRAFLTSDRARLKGARSTGGR